MDDTTSLTADDKAALRKMLEDAIAKLPMSTARVTAFVPPIKPLTLWQRIKQALARMARKKGG